MLVWSGSLRARDLPCRLAAMAYGGNPPQIAWAAAYGMGRLIGGRDLSDQRLSDQYKGAIDCDLHPRVPTPRALAGYMDELRIGDLLSEECPEVQTLPPGAAVVLVVDDGKVRNE